MIRDEPSQRPFHHPREPPKQFSFDQLRAMADYEMDETDMQEIQAMQKQARMRRERKQQRQYLIHVDLLLRCAGTDLAALPVGACKVIISFLDTSETRDRSTLRMPFASRIVATTSQLRDSLRRARMLLSASTELSTQDNSGEDFL